MRLPCLAQPRRPPPSSKSFCGPPPTRTWRPRATTSGAWSSAAWCSMAQRSAAWFGAAPSRTGQPLDSPPLRAAAASQGACGARRRGRLWRRLAHAGAAGALGGGWGARQGQTRCRAAADCCLPPARSCPPPPLDPPSAPSPSCLPYSSSQQDRGYWDEANVRLFPKTAAILQGLNGGRVALLCCAVLPRSAVPCCRAVAWHALPCCHARPAFHATHPPTHPPAPMHPPTPTPCTAPTLEVFFARQPPGTGIKVGAGGAAARPSSCCLLPAGCAQPPPHSHALSLPPHSPSLAPLSPLQCRCTPTTLTLCRPRIWGWSCPKATAG